MNKQDLFRLVFRTLFRNTIVNFYCSVLSEKSFQALAPLRSDKKFAIKLTKSMKILKIEMVNRFLYVFIAAAMTGGRSIPIAPAIPIPPTMPAILLLTKNQTDLIEVMERYQTELRNYNIQLKKYNYEWDIYSDRLEKYWDQEMEEQKKLMNEMSQLSVRG